MAGLVQQNMTLRNLLTSGGENLVVSRFLSVHSFLLIELVKGAIFLDRHRRREAMEESSDATRGIRISCPLHKIDHVVHGTDNLASIRLSGAAPGFEPDRCFLGPIVPVAAWDTLQDYVEQAKKRAAVHGTDLQAPVYFDFGPLTLAENTAATDLNSGAMENAVRSALSLGSETNLWS